MRRSLLMCLLLAISVPVFAAYKCEVGGKVTYSDVPCPDGKGKELKQPEPNTASSRNAAQATQQNARDKKELTRLETQRHKREAIEEKEARQAARAAASHRKKCDTLAQRVKWDQEDAAHAAGRSAEKAKRKARRMDEKYALECGK